MQGLYPSQHWSKLQKTTTIVDAISQNLHLSFFSKNHHVCADSFQITLIERFAASDSKPDRLGPHVDRGRRRPSRAVRRRCTKPGAAEPSRPFPSLSIQSLPPISSAAHFSPPAAGRNPPQPWSTGRTAKPAARTLCHPSSTPTTTKPM